MRLGAVLVSDKAKSATSVIGFRMYKHIRLLYGNSPQELGLAPTDSDETSINRGVRFMTWGSNAAEVLLAQKQGMCGPTSLMRWVEYKNQRHKQGRESCTFLWPPLRVLRTSSIAILNPKAFGFHRLGFKGSCVNHRI